ncbi:hypothetical protein LT679_03685 [Mucilaginibacter roseus]|uniref:RiboL-PSP-HEPN domain-containing protein n=1 Tax=Mucilaginibacter roseus TaxID=1528868 RepID=A0ABS8U0U0_9SPHI|nr:hypothetical protein [Mucilaginibacter roseus]MCD8739695.1 hypothetical protein [Mucilaginibacter roseus]
MNLKVKITRDFIDPIKCYLEDALVAERDAVKSDYYQRNHVRVVFSVIEGTIHILKQTCLTAAIHAKKLTPGDYALLQELSFDLSPKGEVVENPKFIRLDTNFKYCVKSLNKVFLLNYHIDTNGADWNHFKKAISIRNRLTHPKGVQDMVITSADAEILVKVSGWFCDFTHQAVTGILAKIQPSQVMDG